MEDFRDLGKILPEPTVFGIINDKYNYVEAGDYGRVTETQFLDLCKTILPQNLFLPQMLKAIYQVFSGEHEDPEEAADRQN